MNLERRLRLVENLIPRPKASLIGQRDVVRQLARETAFRRHGFQLLELIPPPSGPAGYGMMCSPGVQSPREKRLEAAYRKLVKLPAERRAAEAKRLGYGFEQAPAVKPSRLKEAQKKRAPG